MRTFVLYSTKGRTDSNFSLEDLPSSGGRMDIVARFISTALFISHKMRENIKVYIVLNGPPSPPVTILFDSSISKVAVDERSMGLWIRKLLEELGDKKELKTYNGLQAFRKSFQELIKELANEGEIYVFHEKGTDIGSMEFSKNPILIMGDHLGLEKNIETWLQKKIKSQKVSLGNTPYLASQCISVINWFLDRQ